MIDPGARAAAPPRRGHRRRPLWLLPAVVVLPALLVLALAAFYRAQLDGRLSRVQEALQQVRQQQLAARIRAAADATLAAPADAGREAAASAGLTREQVAVALTEVAGDLAGLARRFPEADRAPPEPVTAPDWPALRDTLRRAALEALRLPAIRGGWGPGFGTPLPLLLQQAHTGALRGDPQATRSGVARAARVLATYPQSPAAAVLGTRLAQARRLLEGAGTAAKAAEEADSERAAIERLADETADLAERLGGGPAR